MCSEQYRPYCLVSILTSELNSDEISHLLLGPVPQTTKTAGALGNRGLRVNPRRRADVVIDLQFLTVREQNTQSCSQNERQTRHHYLKQQLIFTKSALTW